MLFPLYESQYPSSCESLSEPKSERSDGKSKVFMFDVGDETSRTGSLSATSSPSFNPKKSPQTAKRSTAAQRRIADKRSASRPRSSERVTSGGRPRSHTEA